MPSWMARTPARMSSRRLISLAHLQLDAAGERQEHDVGDRDAVDRRDEGGRDAVTDGADVAQVAHDVDEAEHGADDADGGA